MSSDSLPFPSTRSPAELSELLSQSILPISRQYLAPEGIQQEIKLLNKKLATNHDNYNNQTAVAAPTSAPVVASDSAPAAESSVSGSAVDSCAVGESGGRKRYRERGANRVKDRKHFKVEKNPGATVCPGLASGRVCPFPSSCQYSHDLSSYLASRPYPDLSHLLSCPYHSRSFICKFGINCRYLSSHFDESTLQLLKPLQPRDYNELNLNQYSNELLKDLRLANQQNPLKQAAIFPLSSGLMEHLKQYNQVMKGLGKKREEKNKYNLIVEAAEKEKEREREKERKEKEMNENNGDNGDNKANQESKKVEPAPFELLNPLDYWSSDFGALYPYPRKSLPISPDKLWLAPLTTLGHLPFRRLCVEYGTDVTVGEMSLALSILQGNSAELTHVKRHSSEKCFGIQLAAPFPDLLMKCSEFLSTHFELDFIDLNTGCPNDQLVYSGMCAGLIKRSRHRIIEPMLQAMNRVSKIPITLKTRLGWDEDEITIRETLVRAARAGVAALQIHGRTRAQRYTRSADWATIKEVAQEAKDKYDMPVIANGDVYSFVDYEALINPESAVSGVMIGRGALQKPWIFTEIKERRHWDISSSERFDMIKRFTGHCLEYFGSDARGVETSRRFLLEFLSFLCRYVPYGLVEQSIHPSLQLKPQKFVARDDLEQLMASRFSEDWVRISEMLLGPVPEGFHFVPKHKSNSYSDKDAPGAGPSGGINNEEIDDGQGI